MIRYARYPVAAAICLSFVLIGWQAIDPFRTSSALADDINSRIAASFSNEHEGAHLQSNLDTTIRHTLGRPAIMVSSQLPLAELGLTTQAVDFPNSRLTFWIEAEEGNTPGQILYEIDIHLVGQNGDIIETISSPAMLIESATSASVEMAFEGGGRLHLEVTPEELID